MTVETQAPVTISYSDLVARPEALKADIERALGSDAGCLGVILVKGESFPRPVFPASPALPPSALHQSNWNQLQRRKH